MAKHSIHFATGPRTVDNLRACVARAVLEGVNLHRHGKLSRSRIIDTAIEYGAQASKAELRPATPALPQTTGTTDADRLARAMVGAGITSPKALAEQLGYKDKASVQNVKTKGMKLSGRLLEWVETQEAKR